MLILFFLVVCVEHILCMEDNGKKTFVSSRDDPTSGFKKTNLEQEKPHLQLLDLTGRNKSPKEALAEIGVVITDEQEAQYFRYAREATEAMHSALLSSPSKKPKIDDNDDPLPPDCFIIEVETAPQGVPLQQELLSKASSSFFEDDLWRNSLDLSLVDIFSPPTPPINPLYYLMVYDFNIKNVRTFFAESKMELLKKYLICYVNEAHTEESNKAQAHLHAKVPHMPVLVQDNEYVIRCNVGAGLCKHKEVAESRELLIVQLFAHFVTDHCKDSAWYTNMSKKISGSVEEARAKLYGTQ